MQKTMTAVSMVLSVAAIGVSLYFSGALDGPASATAEPAPTAEEQRKAELAAVAERQAAERAAAKTAERIITEREQRFIDHFFPIFSKARKYDGRPDSVEGLFEPIFGKPTPQN